MSAWKPFPNAVSSDKSVIIDIEAYALTICRTQFFFNDVAKIFLVCYLIWKIICKALNFNLLIYLLLILLPNRNEVRFYLVYLGF